jgi:S-adenosylmethionine:tRNA ribosyltransferase-isomerase
MVLDRWTGAVEHRSVAELPELLPEGALLVFNDSRVRKARIEATRAGTGGAVELLFVEPLPEGDNRGDESSARADAPGADAPRAGSAGDTSETGSTATRRWLVTTNKAKRQRVGTRFELPGGRQAEIIAVEGAYRVIECDKPLTESYFEHHGHVPLPPYIEREDRSVDAERYQTVYADQVGSIAAPTAGLHFTDELMTRIRAAGHGIAFVTLHVGLGTFSPVRTEEVEAHKMHEERYTIDPAQAELINGALREGRHVVAVGTTTLRTLESAVAQVDEAGRARAVSAGSRSTRLFVYPGFEFRVITSMFTNFHTPESSLLMLVSAFAGRERVLNAYQEAVRRRYRFFSYGDAMLIRG